VDQQRATRLESNNYMLAATVDGCDAFGLQLGRHLEGIDRACQARIEDLDPFEAAPQKDRLQSAADGLDLW
jgi:hypothetical protein